MSIRHKCEFCGQTVHGIHSVIPSAEAHMRAENLREDGWRIKSRFPGWTWHGEWLMYPPGDDYWPAWHCAMSLEELLHMMDTRPADTWDDLRELAAEMEAEIAAGIEAEQNARPAPVQVLETAPIVLPDPHQLSLFA